MSERPLLIVFSGRPGTGKSTVAQRIVERTRSCYLRVDAAETALARLGRDVREDGYAVVFELAVSNLLAGMNVVVDAVNPSAEARRAWPEAATRGGAQLTMIETVLPDPVEHRKRVEHRLADIPGHLVPTWEEVRNGPWTPWDETRDGQRLVVDTTETDRAVATIMTATGSAT